MSSFEVVYGNVNGIVKVKAEQGEKIIVRSGAMVAMNPVFEMKLKSGGLKKAVGRMFAGQSTFLQEYTATDKGEIMLSPSFLGDIEIIELDGSKSYRLGQNAFLASEGDIELNTKMAGGKGLFSGEGILQVEASGIGKMVLCAYGAIHKMFLEEGKEYIVDTNHLVLWDNKMQYKVQLISGGITSLASGEGCICRFTGPGTIWIQTKNPSYLMAPGT